MIDSSLAWALILELRKEVLELQKLRAQVVSIKITAVGAGIGLIAGNSDAVGWELLIVPAVAAVCFDLHANGYGGRIKRIGLYIKTVLEPRVAAEAAWEAPLWEQYLSSARGEQWYLHVGSLGLTLIAVVGGAIGLAVGSPWYLSTSGSILLALLFWFDWWTTIRPRRLYQSDPLASSEHLPERGDASS
jgi:hypothetical protein